MEAVYRTTPSLQICSRWTSSTLSGAELISRGNTKSRHLPKDSAYRCRYLIGNRFARWQTRSSVASQTRYWKGSTTLEERMQRASYRIRYTILSVSWLMNGYRALNGTKFPKFRASHLVEGQAMVCSTFRTAQAS